MASAPAFVGTPKCGLVQIVNADASNQKTLVSAGANGSKIVSVMLSTDDTSSRIIQLSIKRSSTNYILGSVTVATLAGTDGVTPAQPAFDLSLLRGLPVDNDGNPFIFLESGDELDIKSTTTVTSGKTVHAVAVYGDF